MTVDLGRRGADRLTAPASTAATRSPPCETLRRGLALLARARRGLRLDPGAGAARDRRPASSYPIAVQQTLDKGINGPDGVDLVASSPRWRSLAALAIVVTGVSSYFMTARLFTASERGLATLRIKAFRHVHDLPLLTQNTERRGALVSRVTSDVDQVSQFLVFGGIFGIISVGQVLLATVVMLFYSWQLTILVWVCFLPLFLSLRYFQRRLSAAYGVVRRSVGTMLSAISEPVVGAVTVRTYAIEKRTQDRIDEAIPANQVACDQGPGADRVLVLPRRGLGRPGQRGRADRRHLARASPATSPPARCSPSRSW